MSVWNYKGDSVDGETSCESIPIRYEELFVSEVAEKIVDALGIKWGSERDIVKRLIKFSLRDLCDRKGLLEQYLHSQLNIISGQLNRKFNINEKVCEDNAIHAKLCKHIDAIKKMIKEVKDE